METSPSCHLGNNYCGKTVRQVDWAIPPRPIGEFFGKFTGLPEQSKLVPRLKCNLYYYREGSAQPPSQSGSEEGKL